MDFWRRRSPKKQFIKATKNINNIKFLPLQDERNLNEWLNLGDIHIIPQKKEVEDLVFPSKLLGILASGNPVIANASLESELGRLVEIVGIRVDPEDTDGFIDGLNKLIDNEKLRLNIGYQGREIAEERFCREKLLEEFNNLIMHSL